MNYFAHGRNFLDRPYFAAGTAIPDWLNVVDRRVRVRSKHAEPFLTSEDPVFRELAAGVTQHHKDDDWFHRTRAFAELSMQFAVLIRDELPADDGLRPSFLGHILVELLLDDWLAKDEPGSMDAYYDVLAKIDPTKIANFVQTATDKPVPNMPRLIKGFIKERFLYDYADNAKLLYRLNGVMSRVGLAKIPDEMLDLLPRLREAVRARQNELMNPGA